MAENISLREEIVSLNHEASKSLPSRQFGDEIDGIKGKLEDKLAELGGLISDLGFLPQNIASCSNTARQSIKSDTRMSLDTDRPLAIKPIRDRSFLDDQRLPVIMEDKCYPRLTLE